MRSTNHFRYQMLWFALIILLAGCAYQQRPDVALNYEPSIQTPFQLADNQVVGIRVRDDRPIAREDIGLIALGAVSEVDVENDLTEQVYQAMYSRLINEGFLVVPAELLPERTVNVSVLALDIYKTFAVLGTVNTVRARIDVVVQNGPRRYRKTHEDRLRQFVLYGNYYRREQAIATQVNTAYANIMTEILTDPLFYQELLENADVTL